MATFALVCSGSVTELSPTPFPVYPSLAWVDVTNVNPQPQVGWSATEAAGIWTFTPPPQRSLTIAQQAMSALSNGVTITSTSNPSLSGTYACDAQAQANITSMFSFIQRAGGSSFPSGLSSLPWPVVGGTVTFGSVNDFLNVGTAIGNYVLALTLIAVTGTGTLPAPTITIP